MYTKSCTFKSVGVCALNGKDTTGQDFGLAEVSSRQSSLKYVTFIDASNSNWDVFDLPVRTWKTAGVSGVHGQHA